MALPEEQDEIGKLQRILERKLIMPAPQPPPEPVGQARLGGGLLMAAGASAMAAFGWPEFAGYAGGVLSALVAKEVVS
jgi:hypothetical protein